MGGVVEWLESLSSMQEVVVPAVIKLFGDIYHISVYSTSMLTMCAVPQFMFVLFKLWH